MVIKWKKICEKWCEKWWKRSILWGIFFVSCVLFFLGLGVAASDAGSLGGAFEYWETTDYVSSPLLAKDVREAFKEVKEKSTSDTYVPPDEWSFKGIYDYVLERGIVTYRHKTNISPGAYTEYIKRQEEVDKRGIKAEIQAEMEAGLKKRMADWYFKEHFSCYYIWNGDAYERGESTGEHTLDGIPGNDEAVKIGIGFSEEMLQEGGLRLERIYVHLQVGIILMILGGLIAILSLFVRVCGINKNGTVRMYYDVLSVVCIAALILLCRETPRMIQGNYLDMGTERMLLSVVPQAFLLGILLAVVFFALFCLFLGLCRGKADKKNFFLFRAFMYTKHRITGEAYYEEGFPVFSQKRFRFSLILSLAGMAAIVLVLSNVFGDGRLDWFMLNFVSRETACILLLSGIFVAVVLGIYGWGEHKVSREYQKLQNQMEQIYQGSYQNHEMLSDDSVFAAESQRLSMLGCQMQENVTKQIQAEKMKMDLITNVSHDLKTPLTSIISYIDLLEKEDLPPAASDYVKVLEKKAAYLRKMIADVFDLTKASSGNMEIRKESVDFKMLLQQTLGDMQQQIDKAPVKVVTDVPEHPVMLQGDGEKLYRILQNTMENALKYSMEHTRVYVSLSENARDAVLRIKNVAGYEMNFTKEEVIGRFFRGDKARSTEGSGLGLAIAKEFTEACGGSFDVDVDGDVFLVEVRLTKYEVIQDGSM